MTHVDTSSFALKTNLANLKTEADKLDIHKLAQVPVDLSKLSDVVKNDVVKKTVYNKLVAKVDNIDTSDFVLKAKYQTKKTELENKIRDVCNLVKKTKLTELDKYIDTSEFNKLAADVFNEEILQANLITKADFDAKLSSFNKKITQNKTKHLLVENKLNKLKTFDSRYFIGKSHFEEDGTQNYLVFQPMYRYFKLDTNTFYILSWQSKGLSNENIAPPNTNFSPSINYVGNKIRVRFTGTV